MSAIYISPHLSAKAFGGSHFAATNLQLLRDALDARVTAASVSRAPHPEAIAVPVTKDKLGTAQANLQGLCGTLSRKGVGVVRELLLHERPTLIWLDTSLLGTLIPMIRALRPQAKVICAFQNVEADLVRRRIAALQLHYLPALYATAQNERLSARAADMTLALHAVDAERLHLLYGRAVDALLPIIVADRHAADSGKALEQVGTQPYVLFVGSAFPPNLEALDFICREVAPRLRHQRVLAIGSGLDRVAARFAHPRLAIHGFVDDLAALYRGASAVIAPVVSGGGMKVKIAEALMYGKAVIATPFAAIGYEACSANSIRLASRGDEFAAHIEQRDSVDVVPYARADYERLFSPMAGMIQMRAVLAAAQVPRSDAD